MEIRKMFEWLGYSWKTGVVVFLLAAATAIAASAQTFTTLVDFNGTNGAGPLFDSLVQGRDGNLYGTTSGGGVAGYGTVFKMAPDSTLTTLYSFCSLPYCADGSWPKGGLVLAMNGNLYGTAYDFGNCDDCEYWTGTVFKITPEGKLTTLYSFGFGDGAYPTAALVQGTDGNFYGTTSQGGDDAYDWAHGEVFGMTPNGELWQLHVFQDYAYPIAGLVQATNGDFYGTTSGSGDHDAGSIFKITAAGTLTRLYSFTTQAKGAGASPLAALVQASDGNLYGTTAGGGAYDDGTVFRMAPKVGLTKLHDFNGTDGSSSHGPLLQATDRNFYGTTSTGGANNLGTIFKMSMDGTLTTLYSFQGSDGSAPVGGLVEDTSGKFYGTTSAGGMYGDGTIFSLDMGLGPFVRLVRDLGKVGQTGGILGQGFSGATAVTLNGVPAEFTVVSDTYLTATIPAGGTTGFVTVTTPSGTLTSNKPFRVEPQLLSFDPPSGPPGTQVTITGVSLTQTQGVGFGNRVPAQFTVNSDNQVTATVPEGAQTGKIGIQTQGGKAISSGTFTVTP